MRKDVTIGMFFSQFIVWSIIITTAGSLHINGITDIETADQAAQALEPLVNTFPYSGEISKIIFALGIIVCWTTFDTRSFWSIRLHFIRYIWMERRTR